MSVKISEMTEDASVGGAEMIPVSDAGTAKRTTPSALAAYTVDQIEAIAAGVAVTGADSVFVLQGGALKPVDIDLVCQHAIDTVWGKAAEASPDSADVMVLKDGGTTEKTVTLASLASYVQTTIEAGILDVSDLDAASALTSADLFLVTQSTTGKKVAFSAITSAIYDSLDTYVAGKDAVTVTADADVFYCLQGGVAKKVTLSQIIAHYGSAVSGSGTTDYLASWSDANTLQAGPSIVLSATGFSAGSDTEIPTTKAVRGELDTVIDAIIPPAVDGTLATGANADFEPTKLVYNKTCSDSDGDDVIDLHDGTQLGQIVTIYLGTQSGSDDAIITPVTALSYSTITLDAANEIATLQWQGAAVGWAILYTNGTVA